MKRVNDALTPQERLDIPRARKILVGRSGFHREMLRRGNAITIATDNFIRCQDFEDALQSANKEVSAAPGDWVDVADVLAQLREATKSIVKHDGMKVRRGLAEYIAESEHAGWDGFTAADLVSIAQFLEDFAVGLDNEMGEGDPSNIDEEFGL